MAQVYAAVVRPQKWESDFCLCAFRRWNPEKKYNREDCERLIVEIPLFCKVCSHIFCLFAYQKCQKRDLNSSLSEDGIHFIHARRDGVMHLLPLTTGKSFAARSMHFIDHSPSLSLSRLVTASIAGQWRPSPAPSPPAHCMSSDGATASLQVVDVTDERGD